MPGSSTSSTAAIDPLGQATSDPATGEAVPPNALASPSAGQADAGSDVPPASPSPAETIFLGLKSALDNLEATLASIPGIGGDQLAQLHNLFDSIASVLQTFSDNLSQSNNGLAVTDWMAPALGSAGLVASQPSDPVDSAKLAEALSGDLHLASIAPTNTSPYGYAAGAGEPLPFVFHDAGGQYGFADLIETNASFAGAAQYVSELWANLLDVYRPSGQAALGVSDSGGDSVGAVLAASSLAQSPTGS